MCKNENFDILVMLKNHNPDELEDILSKIKDMRDLEDLGGVKSTVIPNGIDFSEIESVEIKDHNTGTSALNSDVLYAGRLIKEKNLELLLESIETVRSRRPDVKCLIVGEGPEREKLEKIVLKKNLKDNIEFMAYGPQRLFLQLLIFLAPIFIIGTRSIARIMRKPRAGVITAVILIIALFLTGTYLQYHAVLPDSFQGVIV